jgi:16S rRNA (guanine527-N7)-methyltransferase
VDSRTDDLRRLLSTQDLPEAERWTEKLLVYYELLLNENERQNLTRLVSPVDFVEGHVLDVLEMLKAGFVTYPAMDLGSGAGIPGLIAALLGSGPWILCESEVRKADFLRSTASALGLTDVSVVADRAENYLVSQRCASVVSRAVGSAEKIYSWIGNCSTWNNLILFKGPRWTEEKAELQRGRFRNQLTVTGEHRYETGAEKKTRVLVRLDRTPRRP